MQSKKMKKISSEREIRVRSCPLIITIVIAAIGAIFTARDDEDYRIYNTLITELHHLVKQLEESVRERDNKIAECNDWIRRLLEYMDLSEDDMNKIIQKDKDMAEVSQRLLDMDRLVSGLFYGGR